METDEVFIFLAQPVEETMVDETAKPSNSSISSKRARSESGEEVRSKPAVVSFKSTLLNMANSKCWKEFGATKEKLRGGRNYQGHRSGWNGVGGRNVRADNKSGHGLVNVKSKDKTKAGFNGPTVFKSNAADNLEVRGGEILKEKDMEDGNSEVNISQKGKSGAAKKKGVLYEVTNVKITPSNSKKPIKAKVIATVGDGSHA
ncbi:hypothetical protein ACOSQ3_023168 [Xanthoceras sorbifolium]